MNRSLIVSAHNIRNSANHRDILVPLQIIIALPKQLCFPDLFSVLFIESFLLFQLHVSRGRRAPGVALGGGPVGGGAVGIVVGAAVGDGDAARVLQVSATDRLTRLSALFT